MASAASSARHIRFQILSNPAFVDEEPEGAAEAQPAGWRRTHLVLEEQSLAIEKQPFTR
jgi:hypothetical protein